jgi:hypothetical protein
MDLATLKYIILGLLFICVIWLIRTIVKKETENLLRTILLIVIFFAIFFYLQHQKIEKITYAYVKAQFKEMFFPESPLHYVYYKEEGTSGGSHFIRYSFESPGPALAVSMDADHKYFHLRDVYSLNRVLEYVGLPKVDRPVQELASITGKYNDINLYRWDDYAWGVLTVERQICQDRDRLNPYQCIMAIMVTRR